MPEVLTPRCDNAVAAHRENIIVIVFIVVIVLIVVIVVVIHEAVSSKIDADV